MDYPCRSGCDMFLASAIVSERIWPMLFYPLIVLFYVDSLAEPE